jgi:hypothetical protein
MDLILSLEGSLAAVMAIVDIFIINKQKSYGICPRIFSNPFSPTAPTARSTACPL